jgi:hypothetical protein
MASQKSGTGASIEASVQILNFDPGLYRMSFASQRGGPADPDAGFPWAKLEAPPGARPGQSTIAVQGENGWLSRTGDSALVQVVGGCAPLLLTIYQVAGALPPPEFTVQRLDVQAVATLHHEPPLAEAAPSAEAPARATDAAVPLAMSPPWVPSRAAADVTALIKGVAHVQGHDVTSGAEGWIGVPGGAMPLEGFSLTLAGPSVAGLEYCATLGPDWSTPWVRDGEFCGSRGLALPLLGLTARLVGSGAQELSLRCYARFVGGAEIGPVPGGDLCAAPDGVPIEAFRIIVTARHRETGDAPAEAGAAGVPGARRKPKGKQKHAGITNAAEICPGPVPS